MSVLDVFMAVTLSMSVFFAEVFKLKQKTSSCILQVVETPCTHPKTRTIMSNISKKNKIYLIYKLMMIIATN